MPDLAPVRNRTAEEQVVAGIAYRDNFVLLHPDRNDHHNHRSVMKRYQCIKNFYMEDTGELAFKAGDTYQADNLIFKSRVSPRHVISRKNVEIHFQELVELSVYDIPDDQYENPLEDWHPLTLMEERQLPAWARIAVAVFISAILLFLIATL